MLKNNKGITLIALVITIIVLLILAGVSIAMLTGDNGILNQATRASDENNKAEVLERVNMELNAQLTNAMAHTAFDTKADIIKHIGTLPTGYSVEVTAEESNPTYGTTGKSVSIVVRGEGIDPTPGTVTYDTGTNTWKVTPVKEATTE